MNPTLRLQADNLIARHEEVAALLAEPAVLADAPRFRGLSQEYARLEDLVGTFEAYRRAEQQLSEAQSMREDADPEVRTLAAEEVALAERQLQTLEQRLQRLLLPPDPNDQSDVFLEVRAGTGGERAVDPALALL